MKDINTHNINLFMELTGKAARPVIVTHARPDGDAIGSSVAMYHFLRMAGRKDVRIVLNDNYPDYLRFLTEAVCKEDLLINDSTPANAREAIIDSDLIICLDFHAFHRTKDLEPYLQESNAPKILIDHHLDPDRNQYALTFSKTDISSASELVYSILMATPLIAGDAARLPSEASLAIMTGMTTDTNNFNNSVYPSTLAMASELLKTGTDRELILNKINLEHSESRLRLKGHMLKDLMQVTEDGVAYMVLDRKTQEEYRMKEGDTEGFVNEPLSIADVRMSILAKEDTQEIRISIRSKKGTSANRCAKLFFDGGGHENAAGGRLHIPISETGDYIRKYTHIYMTEHEE